MKNCLKSVLGFPAALLLAGLLGSCGNQWSETQKANLTPVTVRQTAMASGAYHEPDATNPPGTSNTVPAATGGGLIPALIGVAIDAGVSKSQQSKFDKSDGHYAGSSKQNVPGDLTKRFSEKFDRSLKKDAFFNGRLKQEASALIQPTIVKHGYKRVGVADDGGILMSPVVEVELLVTGSDAKILLKQNVTSPGGSPARLSEYAGSAAKARAAYDKELDSLITQIGIIWNTKLGR
jgi:hypothetical protein